jgi:hypothetical protein
VVHGLLSLQAAVLAGCVQLPPAQMSSVQTLLSLAQGAVLLTFPQVPVLGLQSSVHGLPSSGQARGDPTQTPAVQRSVLVHLLLSLQVAVLLTYVHPFVLLHESLVHGLPSLQSMIVPRQAPAPLHLSLAVQALPSSQDTVVGAGVKLQAPVVGFVQASIVHGLPSLQRAHRLTSSPT